MIKYTFSIIVAISLLACQSKDPKSLARKYCACFKAANADPVKLQECQEIANANQAILGKDVEKSQVYAQEIIRCAVYEQPE